MWATENLDLPCSQNLCKLFIQKGHSNTQCIYMNDVGPNADPADIRHKNSDAMRRKVARDKQNNDTHKTSEDEQAHALGGSLKLTYYEGRSQSR